jgi:hypothetical protein
MPTKKGQTNGTRARAAWLSLVERTLAEISQWAGAEHWPVARQEKEFREEALGSYSAAVLTIQLPSGQLHVEPIARYVAGAEGRIDLLSFPLLNRVVLLRQGRKWVPRTDSGVDYPGQWNRRTFVKLAQALANST